MSDTRYTGDFIQFLYGMTLYDQLPLVEIPENVHIKGQDGEATANWVGESKPIPATEMDFSDVELTGLEVGALAVVSNKLLRTSAPSAEQLIRNALGKASGKRMRDGYHEAMRQTIEYLYALPEIEPPRCGYCGDVITRTDKRARFCSRYCQRENGKRTRIARMKGLG